jgi:hypothetical protein
MIVVRAHRYVFALQDRIAAFPNGHDILRGRAVRLYCDRDADFLIRAQVEGLDHFAAQAAIAITSGRARQAMDRKLKTVQGFIDLIKR